MVSTTQLVFIRRMKVNTPQISAFSDGPTSPTIALPRYIPVAPNAVNQSLSCVPIDLTEVILRLNGTTSSAPMTDFLQPVTQYIELGAQNHEYINRVHLHAH